jgi:hypothetical protein
MVLPAPEAWIGRASLTMQGLPEVAGSSEFSMAFTIHTDDSITGSIQGSAGAVVTAPGGAGIGTLPAVPGSVSGTFDETANKVNLLIQVPQLDENATATSASGTGTGEAQVTGNEADFEFEGQTRDLSGQFLRAVTLPPIEKVSGGTATITASYGGLKTTTIVTIWPAQCEVTPLTPLTDPLAIREEAGEIIWDNTDPALQGDANCLVAAVQANGGNADITSAYRDPQYQHHLWEVVTKQQLLANNTNPACSALKAQIDAEMQKHGLRPNQPVAAGPQGQHVQGNAVDIHIGGLNLAEGGIVDNLAAGCGLVRTLLHPPRGQQAEPWHFELQ